MEHLVRKCVICGKDINVIHYEDRSYKGGHFFKVLRLPDADAEYYSLGKDPDTGWELFDWKGSSYELEYWECDDCYFDDPVEKEVDGKVEHLCPECDVKAVRCPVGHWFCSLCGWQVEGCDHPDHQKVRDIMDIRGKFPGLTLEDLRDENDRY